MEQTYTFGIRAVEEAIRSGKRIDKIIARKGLNGELFAQLQKLCQERGIRIQYTTPDVLDRITTGNHQGVIAAMSRIEMMELEELLPWIRQQGQTPLLVVLDGITDVRNLGAIARSANCAGAQAIIVPQKGCAPINGESVKTSAGALHHIRVCSVKNNFFAVKYLKDNGVNIVGATEKGAENYFDIDMGRPTAIIMGAEDKGISNQLLKLCDSKAKIPMCGQIESLNVSVAAGILLFEAVRQRMAK